MDSVAEKEVIRIAFPYLDFVIVHLKGYPLGISVFRCCAGVSGDIERVIVNALSDGKVIYTKPLIVSRTLNIANLNYMVVKALGVNFPPFDNPLLRTSNIKIYQATLKSDLTLHDYHVLFFDASQILNKQWWDESPTRRICLNDKNISYVRNFRKLVEEQIETGGVVFCFNNLPHSVQFCEEYETIDNYFFCPLDVGIIG